MNGYKCPECSAALKVGEILKKFPVFPCPACGVELEFPTWWVVLIFYAPIACPPLIFWALGFSWQKIVIAELLFGFPIIWGAVRYAKYVLRPKLVLFAPRITLGGDTALRLHDRPTPNTSEVADAHNAPPDPE
jgi:hypothetical protein